MYITMSSVQSSHRASCASKAGMDIYFGLKLYFRTAAAKGHQSMLRRKSINKFLSSHPMFLPRKHMAAEEPPTAWDGALCVPFADKDAVKALGAAWDPERRLWVVPPSLRHRREAFAKWDGPPAPTAPSAPTYAAKAGYSAAPVVSAAAAAAAAELQRKRESITRELARAVCGAARSRG